MVFSSLVFLFVFLSITLAVYYLLKPLPIVFRNVWLLIASILFYAYGEPEYVFLLLASIVINYACGFFIERCKDTVKAKIWLVTAVTVDLLILFVFKYLNFSVSLLGDLTMKLFGFGIESPGLSLPIGISFFTFQAISYVVDVYRGSAKAQKNPLYLGLYIAMFPQLIAGPIVRYKTIEEQIEHRNVQTVDFALGIERFSIGFSKKVLLANTFAIMADKTFGLARDGDFLTAPLAWLGAISYSLQIFFDFSGYSDMAIGLGRMFGFKYEENFNYPYMSGTVTEFWRRWHISLGSFFRDYVYIPLGGSRVGRGRLILNLFIVWFLTGIWHGAGFNFMLWGLMYFVLLTFEKLTGIGKGLKGILSICYRTFTLVAVVFGWVLFRAESLGTAKRFILSMIGLGDDFYSGIAPWYMKQYWLFFAVAFILCTPVLTFLLKKFEHKTWYGVVKPVIVMAFFMISLTYLVVNAYNPFIYFNF
ncbi:MAG: MBOAT family protein [Acetatifactor sp.]|nr:MBOAT family protein [Acetatifactor sp.]